MSSVSSYSDSSETASSLDTEEWVPPDPITIKALADLDEAFYAFSDALGDAGFDFSEHVLNRLAPDIRRNWEQQALKLAYWCMQERERNEEFTEAYYEEMSLVESALEILRERDLPENLETYTTGLLRRNPLTEMWGINNEKFCLWYIRWLNLLGEE